MSFDRLRTARPGTVVSSFTGFLRISTKSVDQFDAMHENFHPTPRTAVVQTPEESTVSAILRPPVSFELPE